MIHGAIFLFLCFTFSGNAVYYSQPPAKAKRKREAEEERLKRKKLRVADAGFTAAFVQDKEGGSAMRRNDEIKS